MVEAEVDRTTISTKMLPSRKPFSFCCETNLQDSENIYDMRHPPFESAFADAPIYNTQPELKFRVQEFKTSTPAVQRVAIFQEDMEVKKAATYGKSKKGRGFIWWFLEDELQSARDILSKKKAAEKKLKRNKQEKKTKRKRKENVPKPRIIDECVD